ncbi:hypothetical protein CAPTEDRAFT_201911 [Capitella teleta]|uniref:Transmembrane protein 232 n=1 Tax=Capitella teleta TaxID=283909 RepID=R7TJS3_CAPTE|nr:hypothetical protein CAPTEDRAFT_201911 [Capitella teleta]|eukprot:ELT91335.1 hypothetical protein CAPTEDRAFT_201911 [Capitella teleta]
MPIERIPIVHKFGIISHSQRLELQERLLKQSYLQSSAASRKSIASKNPLEVTEEFIQQFNGTENYEEKEKMEDVASKMLHRIKRRAGLKDGGKGSHVDIPIAWTELSQLAQCKGKIQEDCLDLLITSLDQGPLEAVHIPALFFLAETALYWLRTDAIHQPYLRTGELKLLRMGQLVFTRLFFHHMTGHLHGHDDFKRRLHTYLDGFADSQEAYNPYPNALLSMRYIADVGKMIIGDCYSVDGDMKEGVGYEEPQELNETASDQQSETLHTGTVSSSVHDLSPTLWHALDVWRCVRHLGNGLNNALSSLANCGMGLASESWVDGLCALLVLADAAKVDVKALRTLQQLAQGTPPAQSNPALALRASYTPTHDLLQTDAGTGTFAFSPGYTTGGSRKTSGFRSEPNEDGISAYIPSFEESNISPTKLPSILASDFASKSRLRVSMREPLPSSRQCLPKPKSVDLSPDTARGVDAGSLFGDSQSSDASTDLTYSNQVRPELTGLHSWHWEVAITYADVLTDICLHGATSNVQKIALLGRISDARSPERLTGVRKCPISSAGLLDLVNFKACKESNDRGTACLFFVYIVIIDVLCAGPNDWSWRVRYAAIQGLVKICRCCVNDSTKEGLRTVAWNTLVNVPSKEKDSRVLEALKVGQVDANIENLLREHLSVPATAIGAKIASGLSHVYLPALPPPVKSRPPEKKSKPKVALVHPVRSMEPVRTTLREEIMLATALHEPLVSYDTRTKYDLNRIVEDQWRKELQVQLDDGEKDRQEALQKRQTDEEKRQKKVDQNRRQKLESNKTPKRFTPADKVIAVK